MMESCWPTAKKAPPMKLSRKDIFLALAKEVPSPEGGDKLVANPYKTWKDVNPELPADKIEVLGPPPTSGTRDAFVEMVMERGVRAFESIKALKKTMKRNSRRSAGRSAKTAPISRPARMTT